MGVFLEADMSFHSTRKMTVARIMVSLNVREGLVEELELVA
jgi:hypothetical protein